jgi:hypothetical protein
MERLGLADAWRWISKRLPDTTAARRAIGRFDRRVTALGSSTRTWPVGSFLGLGRRRAG